LGSKNVLEAKEPVFIGRSDDGPIGPKHVALNVLLMVIIDVLDTNINTWYKIWNTSGQKLNVIDRPCRNVGKQPSISEKRRPQLKLLETSEARYAWSNECGALSRKVMDEMCWAL
jgi:hypothetical protein